MDPIADMLVRIRNAMTSRHKEVRIPYSKIKFEIARILLEEGYINNFRTAGGPRGAEIGQDRQMSNAPIPDTRSSTANARKPKTESKRILIQLKYLEGGKPVIYGMKRLSKSSRRIYVGSDEIPRVLGGLGISILSTSRGIMTDKEARKEDVGGELLASIW